MKERSRDIHSGSVLLLSFVFQDDQGIRGAGAASTRRSRPPGGREGTGKEGDVLPFPLDLSARVRPGGRASEFGLRTVTDHDGGRERRGNRFLHDRGHGNHQKDFNNDEAHSA